MFISRDRLKRLEAGVKSSLEGLDGLRRVIEGHQTTPPQPYDDAPLWDAIDKLREAIDGQRLAIAEGIERVDRAERRVQQSVRRARARLREHGVEDDGVEAEFAQLRFLDGTGGGEGGVQPVHDPVATPPRPDLSALPGQWGDAEVTAILKAKGMA